MKDEVLFELFRLSSSGKCLATTLSSLGARVCIASRRLPVLEEAAKEISNLTGNQVIPIQCDVRNPEKVSVPSAIFKLMKTALFKDLDVNPLN